MLVRECLTILIFLVSCAHSLVHRAAERARHTAYSYYVLSRYPEQLPAGAGDGGGDTRADLELQWTALGVHAGDVSLPASALHGPPASSLSLDGHEQGGGHAGLHR